MRVQEAKKSLRIQEWATQIKEQKQSGMTIKEWCSTQGYSLKTYYYRLNRVREELLEATKSGDLITLPDKPVFAAVPIPQLNKATVTVRFGICSVEIMNEADAVIIEQVLQIASCL